MYLSGQENSRIKIFKMNKKKNNEEKGNTDNQKVSKKKTNEEKGNTDNQKVRTTIARASTVYDTMTLTHEGVRYTAHIGMIIADQVQVNKQCRHMGHRASR